MPGHEREHLPLTSANPAGGAVNQLTLRTNLQLVKLVVVLGGLDDVPLVIRVGLAAVVAEDFDVAGRALGVGVAHAGLRKLSGGQHARLVDRGNAAVDRDGFQCLVELPSLALAILAIRLAAAAGGRIPAARTGRLLGSFGGLLNCVHTHPGIQSGRADFA